MFQNHMFLFIVVLLYYCRIICIVLNIKTPYLAYFVAYRRKYLFSPDIGVYLRETFSIIFLSGKENKP